MTLVLAIVPARAGSKGVPGKNRTVIAGRHIIDYTLAALEAADCVGGIVLTTDDAEILEAFRERAGVMLIDRPAALATDDTSTADVVAHALQTWRSSGRNSPDALLLAQPTTPLRTASDVDAAFALWTRHGGESLISVCRAEGIRHPDVMYRSAGDVHRGVLYVTDADRRAKRQEQDVVYQRNGAIYLVRTTFFETTRQLRSTSPVMYEMPWARSINIDTPDDMLIAKALLEIRAPLP